MIPAFFTTCKPAMSTPSASLSSTSELIAGRIRAAIISGEYRSGQPLKQDELAELHQVSKIPVREALYQLKTEGLVTFQNNRGSMVSHLSSNEVEEIYTMRIALEAIALERAIPNLTAQDQIAAESALKMIDASKDALSWSGLNWEFHASLYRPANMPKLLDTVSMLHNNVARYLLLYLKEMNFQATSQTEHWELLRCATSGKTKKALGILRQHLLGALDQTLEYMEQRS